MTLGLFLPWLPVILSVGVGARLVGRSRGVFLGVCCALFWVVLVQTGLGMRIWSNGWMIATLVAGSAAIVAMGAWAGQDGSRARRPDASDIRRGGAEPARRSNSADGSADSVNENAPGSPERAEEWSGRADFAGVSEALASFDDWLERNRNCADPWPLFDEFVRSLLHELCGASHVHAFRVLSEGDVLEPLHDMDPHDESGRVSARRGVVGHVATTGRSYVAGDAGAGEMVRQIAADSDAPVDWCFAVRQGARKLGVVAIGQLAQGWPRRRTRLPAVEGLIGLFWVTLSEACRGRAALRTDPVTGVLSREAFLEAAESAVAESYREGEPVAVAAISIEGLRRLDDAGRWDVANALVREAGNVVRRKVRVDDRLGRFDDSRFLLLLRRVDSELAGLIVAQIMNKLTLFGENSRQLGANVAVRCGLAGSGLDTPPLGALIAKALSHGHDARARFVPIATDLAGPAAASAPPPAAAGKLRAGAGGAAEPKS